MYLTAFHKTAFSEHIKSQKGANITDLLIVVMSSRTELENNTDL